MKRSLTTAKMLLPHAVAAAALTASLTIYSASTASAAEPHVEPRVAVWIAPRLAAFNGPTEVSPKRIVADLAAAGVQADLLEADALANPTRLNTSHYAAVVLGYGNLYPISAFQNLKSFHRAGGCLVMDGVPFTHGALHLPDGSWRDMGHQDATALFGPRGMGVGGFRGGPTGQIHPATGDPLGLASARIPWADGDAVQTIDPTTLPQSDQLIPALTADNNAPVSVLVAHHGDGYEGAIDVWANETVRGDDSLSAFATEQLMVRGTVVALTRKGLLPPAHPKVSLAALDRLSQPKALTVDHLPNPPRPYPNLQPKMPPPAQHLYVVDARHHRYDHDSEMFLGSLQGVINRTQPRIYVLWDDDDAFWLEQMQAHQQTGTPISLGVNSIPKLVQMFRPEIRGAVVPDPRVYVSPCVAVDYAGIEDLVIATPATAKTLDLPIVEDLRGRFRNDADAFHYVRTKLLPRLNPYLSISIDPAILGEQLDDIVAAKGMCFWVTGPAAQYHPGADMAAERHEIEATLAALPLSAVVRGYWWHGDGVGLDETPGVSLASRFGKITTVSDYVGNFSVSSGIHLAEIKQKPPLPAPTLDPTKVYLAITVTDGDNLCTWRGYFRQFFTDPLAGEFPVAYGMAPTLIDVAPDQMQWYYEHAPANTEFLCDVSGVGYTNPAAWCTSIGDREDGFRIFYNWTSKYMARTDLHTIRLNLPTATEIARAARDLKNVDFLMPDYQYMGESPLNRITYALPNGTPVFRGITNASARDMAKQIRERVGTTRPAFVNAVVVNWGLRLEDLKTMLSDLGPEYVPVTPSQLNGLYRAAANGK